jgi:hypothetical protein
MDFLFHVGFNSPNATTYEFITRSSHPNIQATKLSHHLNNQTTQDSKYLSCKAPVQPKDLPSYQQFTFISQHNLPHLINFATSPQRFTMQSPTLTLVLTFTTALSLLTFLSAALPLAVLQDLPSGGSGGGVPVPQVLPS